MVPIENKLEGKRFRDGVMHIVLAPTVKVQPTWWFYVVEPTIILRER